MKRGFFLTGLIVLFSLNVMAQAALKREFRAAWIATVTNLDWPSSPSLNVTTQKKQLTDMLDMLKSTGINAVIFQIRTECDALYPSSYDPWSYWLTGQQGRAPVPYYDPLQFAITEAHKRGIQLHAWFNPYRAVKTVGSYTVDDNHVTNQHPEWVVQKGSLKVLDPGLPDVREYIINVVMEVVNNYNIDGVHFDDYFYPYPPDQFNFADDQQTFNEHSRGFGNRGDWRRDNVNILVSAIYDSIQSVRPHIAFGISPFGIWKSGTPEGIVGLNAYNDIYCDAIAWLNDTSVDYLTPQLYWPFGGGQDYGKLMPWWASQMNGRHLMPGHAAYRQSGWPNAEISRQIRLNRKTDSVYGSVFFRAENFYDNPKGLTDSLKNNYYKYKAIVPRYEWKDDTTPNEPTNIQFAHLYENGPLALQWDLPETAVDNDTATFYAVYRFESDNFTQEDIDDAKNIADIVGTRYYFPKSQDGGYFAVTALDDNMNESVISSGITINAPSAPLLAMPENNALNIKDTMALSWRYNEMASSYTVQLAEDASFENLVFERIGLIDTFSTVTNLNGLESYYWRVASVNAGGTSDFSETYTFSTGFPKTPELISPAHATLNVALDTTLLWANTAAAEQYHLQLAYARSFVDELMVLDTVLADTILALNLEDENKIHYWRVKAMNPYGRSEWTEEWGFKTGFATSLEVADVYPQKFELQQNYPNPFNPATTIAFSLDKAAQTTLKVYDMRGRLIATLVDEERTAGVYTINFKAAALASGIYIYRLTSGKNQLVRKMMFIK